MNYNFIYFVIHKLNSKLKMEKIPTNEFNIQCIDLKDKNIEKINSEIQITNLNQDTIFKQKSINNENDLISLNEINVINYDLTINSSNDGKIF